MSIYLGSCVSLGYQKMNETFPFAGLAACAVTSGLIGAGCAMRRAELAMQKLIQEFNPNLPNNPSLEAVKQHFTTLKVASFLLAGFSAGHALGAFFAAGLANGCWPLPELSAEPDFGAFSGDRKLFNISMFSNLG